MAGWWWLAGAGCASCYNQQQLRHSGFLQTFRRRRHARKVRQSRAGSSQSGARQRQSGRLPPRSCLHLACAARGHLIYGPCWPELCHAANDRLGEGGRWLVEDTVAGKDLMAARLGMAWPVRQLLGVKGGQGGFSERGPLATRQLPPQSSRFDPRSIMLSREQQETLPTVNRG